ncbi:MAG TPA: UPF0758 domain-containing protein [Alphaproteobacteria bacterium]|nr:UPF0758 domain-containing protein [Alphaproteobacteria bacterium]
MDERTNTPERPHYLGHRQRLRERFERAGADALPDYEFLELLLCLVIPRGDVKPLAKNILARFGSLAGAMSAERDELASTAGIGVATVHMLKLVHAAGLRIGREEVMSSFVIRKNVCFPKVI